MVITYEKNPVIFIKLDNNETRLPAIGEHELFVIVANMELDCNYNYFDPYEELLLKDGQFLIGSDVSGIIAPELNSQLRGEAKVRYYLGHHQQTVKTPSDDEIQLRIEQVNQAFDCIDSEKIQQWYYVNRTEYRDRIEEAKEFTEQTYQHIYITNVPYEQLKRIIETQLIIDESETILHQTDNVYMGLTINGSVIDWLQFATSKEEVSRTYRRLWIDNKGALRQQYPYIIQIATDLHNSKKPYFIAISNKSSPDGKQVSFDKIVVGTLFEAMKAKKVFEKNKDGWDKHFIVLNRDYELVYTNSESGIECYCHRCNDFCYPIPIGYIPDFSAERRNGEFIMKRHLPVDFGFFIKPSLAKDYFTRTFNCPTCNDTMVKVVHYFNEQKSSTKSTYNPYDEHEWEPHDDPEADSKKYIAELDYEFKWETEQDQTSFDRSPYNYDDDEN